MDWLRGYNWTIRNIESTTNLTDQSQKDKIITNFEKIFKKNRAIKDAEIERELKPGHSSIKQKASPIPYHQHGYAEKEKNKLIQSGDFEKIQELEDRFVSPVVKTVKKDKSVKIALDSGKIK